MTLAILMKSHLIKLTQNINLNDIKTGKVDPVNAYIEYLNQVVFNPVYELLKDKYYGITCLTILLTFFEPHAQYLKGLDSKDKVSKFFKFGMNDFIKYLKGVKEYESSMNIKIEDFYNLMRNGLFHSGIIKGNFTINTLEADEKYPFIKNSYLNEGYLINISKLYSSMKEYLSDYVNKLNTDSVLSNNFTKTFDRLIIEPMEQLTD